VYPAETRKKPARMRSSLKRGEGSGVARLVAVGCLFVTAAFPSVVSATHEADHRFTVEGYVCGTDGKGVADTEVLVKDTRLSYGQVVKTDGNGYYKATFHLHNNNLGDPLLIEARGEQQNHKVQFDPEDLETERKARVNFGTGCDASAPPAWLWWGVGVAAAAIGGAVGVRAVRSQRNRERPRGKSQGKRNQ
jgi:hypothetical protein